jgi:hypothetical protein
MEAPAATPRDLARRASRQRTQWRIATCQPTPREAEAARQAQRRMRAVQNGYTGPLTRAEAARQAGRQRQRAGEAAS